MSNKRYGSIDKEDVVEDIVEEVIIEEVIIKEVIIEEVDVDDFIVIYNKPIISNGGLIFSATISKNSGVIYNGKMMSSANVSNINATTVKNILETIKTDTNYALNLIEANKDWYK